MRDWMVAVREKKSLTQKDLATVVGTTRQMVSAIETNSRNPSVDVAKKIAEALGFDWTRFYDDTG